MDKLDMDKIAGALGAIRITEESGGIRVCGPKIDRSIKRVFVFWTEGEVAAAGLESMGSAEGQDFFHCISIAGRKTGGKVWWEAVVYTSQPGEECPLRLSFYKQRANGPK